jgi:integrase/recombinase XerD
MHTPMPSSVALVSACDADPFAQAQMAAAACLARYGGRTLETYRYDLRTFFQWCTNVGLDVLEAARAHVELWRSALEERGLAASTIDRRLSTICGFYRFAHIDGRIPSNPAQYVRRPKVYPSEGRGLDRGEFGRFLFTAERYDADRAALAALLGLNGLRVSEACATDAEDLGFDRGHRTLRIIGKGNKPAVIPLVPRVARTIDLALGERCEGPILHRHDGQRLDRRTAHRWVRSIGKRAGLGIVHPHMLRAAFIMAALDAGVPLRDVQIAAATPIHGRPPSMTVGARTSTAMLPMSWWPSSPAVRSPSARCPDAQRVQLLRPRVFVWCARQPICRRAPGRRRRAPTYRRCPTRRPHRGGRDRRPP